MKLRIRGEELCDYNQGVYRELLHCIKMLPSKGIYKYVFIMKNFKIKFTLVILDWEGARVDALLGSLALGGGHYSHKISELAKNSLSHNTMHLPNHTHSKFPPCVH